MLEPEILDYAHGKYPKNRNRKDPHRALIISTISASFAFTHISLTIMAFQFRMGDSMFLALLLLCPVALVATAIGTIISALHFNAPWPYRGRARLLISINLLEFLAQLGLLAIFGHFLSLLGAMGGGKY